MADTKIAIIFTAPYVVDDCHKGTPDETRFKEGQKVSLAPASAQHFLSRGVAKLAPVKAASGKGKT